MTVSKDSIKPKAGAEAPKREKEPEKGIRLGYRYRIYPTEEQAREMSRTLGCCRFVFNHYLRARKDAYERTQTEVSRPKPKLDAQGEPVIDGKGRTVYERDPKTGKTVHRMVPNDGPDGTYDPEAKAMSFYDTSKDLTRLKKEAVDGLGRPWLKGADSVALVYALRNLEAAYQNFFRGCRKGQAIGYPRFKKRDDDVQSYTTTCKLIGLAPDGGEVKLDAVPSPLPSDWGHSGVDWRWLQVPKVGNIRVRLHRMPEGRFVSCTVSRDSSGRWFCSVRVKEAEPPVPKPVPAGSEVGITYGASHWAVTSDGEVRDMPGSLQRLYRRLAIAQRDLARKQKGSANYRKQKAKVARINARIADVRRDAVHKMTRDMVDSYGLIASRSMASKEMQQGKAKAVRKLPRKARRKLNRKISEGNFFECNRQLEYKSRWAGRAFVEVPSDAPTAMVCWRCGHVEESLASDLRPKWHCPECGADNDRKANGAKNVLDAGKDILAEEERSFVSKAQASRKAERESRKPDKPAGPAAGR